MSAHISSMDPHLATMVYQGIEYSRDALQRGLGPTRYFICRTGEWRDSLPCYIAVPAGEASDEAKRNHVVAVWWEDD